MTDLDSTSRRGGGVPLRAMLLPALGYVLLTVAMTYPLALHPASTTFPGSSDRNLYIWTLAWDAHALLHQPLSIFDANIFHPYRWTLAYSENLIGAALLVAPVQWAMQNPVLTMNLAALVSVPLCALGAFVLARTLGLGVPSAWISGLVYGFAPPRFLRIDQAHLTAVEWIPFSLAFAHAYGRSGRAYDLRLALAFLSLQAITSGHGVVFLLFTLALWAVYAVATGSRIRVVKAVRDAGIAGALLLMPMLLVFIPYRRVQLDVGLRRDLGDWTGSWASFLSSPTHVDAWILGHLGSLGAFVDANTQAYLFPGYLSVLLAAAAFLRAPQRALEGSRPLAGRSGDLRAFYLVVVIACALLAIGPPYGPWRFLYWLPGLSFIRVPSRFMILAMLGVGVLSAYGFERLAATTSRRIRSIAAAGVTLALCLEFSVVPFELVPDPVEIPAADRWLDTRPKPFVVAEMPFMDPTIPMLHSMAHWQKIVHGYSGWNPPATQELAARLATFPDDASLAALRAAGVMFIVVHGGTYPPGDWPQVEQRLAGADAQLRLEFRDGNDRVYELSASTGDDDVENHSLESPTSTRTWHPSSRVSVDPRSTSAGLNPPGD
jgi:hypothetical protein